MTIDFSKIKAGDAVGAIVQSVGKMGVWLETPGEEENRWVPFTAIVSHTPAPKPAEWDLTPASAEAQRHGIKTLGDLNAMRDWLERRLALEGDLECGVGPQLAEAVLTPAPKPPLKVGDRVRATRGGTVWEVVFIEDGQHVHFGVQLDNARFPELLSEVETWERLS